MSYGLGAYKKTSIHRYRRCSVHMGWEPPSDAIHESAEQMNRAKNLECLIDQPERFDASEGQRVSLVRYHDGFEY